MTSASRRDVGSRTATALPKSEAEYEDFGKDLVHRALRAGASDAEVVIRKRSDFSVGVRFNEVVKLKEASSTAVGVRAFLGQRAASTYSSDLAEDSLQRMIDSAVTLARLGEADEYLGLPDKSQYAGLSLDMQTHCDDVLTVPVEERISYALRAEEAALHFHRQITKSEGSNFDTGLDLRVLVNSHDFSGTSRQSFCSVGVSPIAEDAAGKMQRGGWSAISRSFAHLATPESVGIEGATRALRRLGARKVGSQQVSVVFAPEAARFIVGDLFNAVNGDNIYRTSSFFAGQLGKMVASPHLTLIDDGTLPGGYGTSAFDGEGVRTRRTEVIHEGMLVGHLLNSYSSRRLGCSTTGNAARGLASAPKTGSGNLYLLPGPSSPDDLLRGIERGLYVTDFLGSGTDIMSGSFSRGVAGFWIEHGELTFPVEQVTLAGNMKKLLRNVTAVGSDLTFSRGPVCSPTLCVEGLMIGGL